MVSEQHIAGGGWDEASSSYLRPFPMLLQYCDGSRNFSYVI